MLGSMPTSRPPRAADAGTRPTRRRTAAGPCRTRRHGYRRAAVAGLLAGRSGALRTRAGRRPGARVGAARSTAVAVVGRRGALAAIGLGRPRRGRRSRRAAAAPARRASPCSCWARSRPLDRAGVRTASGPGPRTRGRTCACAAGSPAACAVEVLDPAGPDALLARLDPAPGAARSARAGGAARRAAVTR